MCSNSFYLPDIFSQSKKKMLQRSKESGTFTPSRFTHEKHFAKNFLAL